MSYKRAEEFLPVEIIELVQQYVDGEHIYIPRKKNQRKKWGEKTRIRQEIFNRNQQIYDDFQNGFDAIRLAEKYFLSAKSIQRILYKMRSQ